MVLEVEKSLSGLPPIHSVADDQCCREACRGRDCPSWTYWSCLPDEERTISRACLARLCCSDGGICSIRNVVDLACLMTGSIAWSCLPHTGGTGRTFLIRSIIVPTIHGTEVALPQGHVLIVPASRDVYWSCFPCISRRDCSFVHRKIWSCLPVEHAESCLPSSRRHCACFARRSVSHGFLEIRMVSWLCLLFTRDSLSQPPDLLRHRCCLEKRLLVVPSARPISCSQLPYNARTLVITGE